MNVFTMTTGVVALQIYFLARCWNTQAAMLQMVQFPMLRNPLLERAAMFKGE